MTLFRVQALPANATEEEIEESWSWLSGGVSFLITGILLNIILIQIYFVGSSVISNMQKRDAGQIINNSTGE